ncbi:MAG TPA: LPS export ABC transporter permease LptF [Burkholderiales bacterium]|nr:LPS export ABC transporter permease LptF [Burkholderiales bacterium]
MIFQRALIREFASLASAVFLTLFSIALTTRLIRLLGDAAGGKIPSDAVFAYLGFFSVSTLPVLLSLTLFVSVLLTLTRSYRDSEMVIWFNSGLSLTAWLGPVLKFALPLVALIAATSLFLSPWVAQIGQQFRAGLEARDDVSRVDPGTFGESGSHDRVFFVDSVGADKTTVNNVFVNSVQHQREGVMMSRTGRTETAPNGDRFLVLDDGQRYEGSPGEADYRVMRFGRYATRIKSSEGSRPAASHQDLSTLALMRNPTDANLGELVWRIGIPVAALILVLLAIPMSFVNPRAGRSVNLAFALLTYVVYSNLLSVSQARVTLGRLDFSLGWWLVHAVMVGLLLVLFARRMRLIRLRLAR